MVNAAPALIFPTTKVLAVLGAIYMALTAVVCSDLESKCAMMDARMANALSRFVEMASSKGLKSAMTEIPAVSAMDQSRAALSFALDLLQ